MLVIARFLSFEKKTRAGSDYFELTMWIQGIELLANSGFFGPLESNTITAFFGSSIQNLPNEIVQRFDVLYTTSIFIPKNAQDYTRDARLLNQYIKVHAALPWMFISSKFKNKGYAPLHPLHFQSENSIQVAASLLLKMFTKKVYYKKDIDEAIKNIKELKVTKLTAASNLVIKYITDLKSRGELNFNHYNLIEIKKDMLFIYENVLYGAIKNRSKSLVKKKPQKSINLLKSIYLTRKKHSLLQYNKIK